MVRLKSFSATQYRGINNLTLPQLSQANLITGADGVGKSALMEAIWIFAGRYNPTLLWNAHVQRTPNQIVNPLRRLTDDTLILKGVENDKMHSLECRFEKIDGVWSNVNVAQGMRLDRGSIPRPSGILHVSLNGKPLGEKSGQVCVTPSGSVLFPQLAEPHKRPNNAIESTVFQHESESEDLQRFSDLARKGKKKGIIYLTEIRSETIRGETEM